MQLKPTLLFLLVFLLFTGCQSTLQPIPDGDVFQSEESLKVLSWNVNYGVVGNGRLARDIEKENADVLFLQETTPAWELWAEQHLKRAYPYQDFRHHGAAGGLAVLSKTPFNDVAFVKSPVGWFPGWAVLVQTPLGAVQVLNVHLHPPVTDDGNFVLGYFFTGDKRERELSDFLDELDPKWPTLVVGDFNEASGAALRHAEERGLICALHEVDPGVNTWFWPLGPLTLRDALDHVLHDNMLAVVDAWTLDLGNSDHVPLIAVFSPGVD